MSLPSGITPAITSSTPTALLMALAVFSLSPVIITTLIPIFLSSFIACSLSSFITSATAIIPINLLLANSNGVLPFSANISAFLIISLFKSILLLINLRLPPITSLPFIVPLRPLPARALNSVTSHLLLLTSSAFSITALANGCSLFNSIE